MPQEALAQRRAVVQWVRIVPVIFLLVGFSFGTWLGRLPAIRDHLGASPTQMSIYVLCLAAGSVVGLVSSGRVIHRFGPKRVLLVCGIISAFSLTGAAIIILNGSLAAGLAVLFCFGFAFSLADVAMNVSGANAEVAFGRPRMPLMHAGYSLGAVAATGIGALAEALGISVPVHFASVMFVATVVLLFCLRFLPDDEYALRVASGPSGTQKVTPTVTTTGSIPVTTDTAANSNERLRDSSRTAQGAAIAEPARSYNPWRDPRIIVIGMITLSFGLFEGTAADWLPLALVDGRDLGNDLGSAMLSVFFLAATTTRIAGSWLLLRFSREAVLRGSAVLTAIGLAITIAVPGPAAVIIGVAAWGMGSALGWPIAISAAADNAETAARSVGAVSALGYGAMLIGPLAFGFLGDHFGLLHSFWALLPFAVYVIFAARTARAVTVREL